MYIFSFNDLKFTLKHLKRSYIFRSYDHPQEEYNIVIHIYSFNDPTLKHLKRSYIFRSHDHPQEEYNIVPC